MAVSRRGEEIFAGGQTDEFLQERISINTGAGPAGSTLGPFPLRGTPIPLSLWGSKMRRCFLGWNHFGNSNQGNWPSRL